MNAFAVDVHSLSIDWSSVFAVFRLPPSEITLQFQPRLGLVHFDGLIRYALNGSGLCMSLRGAALDWVHDELACFSDVLLYFNGVLPEMGCHHLVLVASDLHTAQSLA